MFSRACAAICESASGTSLAGPSLASEAASIGPSNARDSKVWSVASSSSQAVEGRPALRQTWRRNDSASHPCSTATPGSSSPTAPPRWMRRPWRPTSTDAEPVAPDGRHGLDGRTGG